MTRCIDVYKRQDIYMKTCKEKALEWNVSPRSVNDMCKKGRIQGAIKERNGQYTMPLTVVIVLMCVGLAIKSALFPFHS